MRPFDYSVLICCCTVSSRDQLTIRDIDQTISATRAFLVGTTSSVLCRDLVMTTNVNMNIAPDQYGLTCQNGYLRTMGSFTLQLPHNERDGVSILFTQPFIQEQIEENTKAPRHWPLCGEFTGDR